MLKLKIKNFCQYVEDNFELLLIAFLRFLTVTLIILGFGSVNILTGIIMITIGYIIGCLTEFLCKYI